MNDKHEYEEGWLCRNCNSLNAAEAPVCAYCHADRPEEDDSMPDGDPEEERAAIRREEYANAPVPATGKYTFRESVLITSADIILIVGLFCALGALIAPSFMDEEIANLRLYSIAGAILLFAWAMISWALLRCVADISRRLRRRDEENLSE